MNWFDDFIIYTLQCELYLNNCHCFFNVQKKHNTPNVCNYFVERFEALIQNILQGKTNCTENGEC